MKIIACCFLMLTSTLSWSATEHKTVTFQDSTTGVVAFDGKIDIAETELAHGETFISKGSVTIKNISAKPIIAIQAVIRMVGFHKEQPKLYTHDFYFKDHGIPVGGSVEVAMDINMTSSGMAPMTREPSLSAQLIFAQFDDGTIAGDQATAHQVLAQRVEVEEFLNHLSTIKDDATLKAELAKPQPAHSMIDALAATLEVSQRDMGTEAVLADVQGRLKNAALRRASGKF